MTEILVRTMILPLGMEAGNSEAHTFALYVEWRGVSSKNPLGTWRVSDSHHELSRAGNWGLPRPFQRHQYRWATRDEALEEARRHVDLVTVNGRTWAEWQIHHAEAKPA